MPRKKSEIPPVLRVRENQRRSRARRKELVDDLQQRLRDYEKKELQATVLVQAAARKVAWENSKLKDLLREKGVTNQEVTSYLRYHEEQLCSAEQLGSAPVLYQTSAAQHCGFESTKTSHLEPISMDCIDQPKSLFSNDQDHASSPLKQNIYTKAERVQYVGPSTKIENAAVMNLGSTSTMAADTMASEISCETAAHIIAGMRGNGDQELARLELGCSGLGDCTVEATRVFDVMQRD